MYTIFLICAVIGGTIFICQFVMALIGFGGENVDVDLVDDLPSDFDLPDDLAGADALGDGQGSVLDHGSTWLFGIISFRTVIAALTFFGLAGLTALSAGLGMFVSLVIALAAGVAAMYLVHALMRLLYSLGHDGTVRLTHAVGKRAVVYVPIPPHRQGVGKVQLRLQGRIIERSAMSSSAEKLSTGARVKVVELVGPATLGVEPIAETEPHESAPSADEANTSA